MPVTNKHVDEEAIERFTADVNEHPAVESVTREFGREMTVRVKRGEKRTPRPHNDVADRVVEGRAVTDEWVAGSLSGGGLAPGNKHVFRLYVSAPCETCGDRPAEDGGICRSCRRGE